MTEQMPQNKAAGFAGAARFQEAQYMSALQFLLLEDKPLDAEPIQAMLTAGGIDYELLRVGTGADFVTALETRAFDLILAAYALPRVARLRIVANP